MNKENYFKVERMPGRGIIPTRATKESTGFDLYASIDEVITLVPLQRALIPSGIKLEGKPGVDVTVRPRSGLAIKEGITVLNAPGTIDPDYTGEIKVPLINLSTEPVYIKPNERIAQLVIPVKDPVLIEGEIKENVERGTKGFGSSGK